MYSFLVHYIFVCKVQSFEEVRLAVEIVSPVMLVVDESCSSWAAAFQDGSFMPSLRLYAFIGDYSSHELTGRGNGKNYNS